MKYFNKFFGIYSDPETIQINFLGKTFVYKRKYLRYEKMTNRKLLIELNKKADRLLINEMNRINQIVKDNISTALLHKESFSEFKNINQNREIMVFATGPSAKNRCIIDDAVKIGVNRSILMDDIKLDYYFAHDYKAIDGYAEKIINYDPKCYKFLGLSREFMYEETSAVIPEELAIKANARRYRTDWFIGKYNLEKKLFACDIDKKALCCCRSVIFAAVQFAMYTNPKRVYLIGCDCTEYGYFDGSKNIKPLCANDVRDGWRKFKIFKDKYYPSCEIISINPVGLKGLFKDVYTESYLEEHPEIDRNKVEIINPKAKLN